MKIIGVTGGVGAGKSTVLDYLKEIYHAHLILADLVGHEVMEPGLPAYDAIIETFGREILSEDQTTVYDTFSNFACSILQRISCLTAG